MLKRVLSTQAYVMFNLNAEHSLGKTTGGDKMPTVHLIKLPRGQFVCAHTRQLDQS